MNCMSLRVCWRRTQAFSAQHWVDHACAFQGKLHDTLKEHEGQLYASMHACREQYLRMKLKKRKRDTDPMTKVNLSLNYHS